MKKISKWLKKFFRIGMGEDVERYIIADGEIKNCSGRSNEGYWQTTYVSALRDGATVIVDHNKKTVTMI